MLPQTTEDILELLDGYITSAALGAAMELGLFWLLAEHPMSSEQVARELAIPAQRCRCWLQVLVKMGLLDLTSNCYGPSRTAQTSILNVYAQDTWAFLSSEASARFPAVRDLACNIRMPASVWETQGLIEPDYFARAVRDPAYADRFTRTLYEIHLPLAEALARQLDPGQARRVLDLGGGSGVVSLALLRRHPELTATVVDTPSVCATGRRIAAENGMENRISYHAADFLSDPLPTGFDIALVCDVGITPPGLLDRIRGILNPRGRLVFVDQLRLIADMAHPTRVSWAFLGSMGDPQGRSPTAEEVKRLLAEAGFKLLSETALQQTQAVRWAEGWTMIEAIACG